MSDPDYYLIKLEKKSSINYEDGKNFIKDKNGNNSNILSNNTVCIKYFNLFGIPLYYLNSKMTIVDFSKDYFKVDVKFPAIVDPNINFYNENDFIQTNQYIDLNRGGGNQSYIRLILYTFNSYPEPNYYEYKLDKIYKNVKQVKITSSIFPNSQKMINNIHNDVINNKLYWKNLDDGDITYYISITPGNYSPNQLKNILEKKFNKIIYYKYSNEFNTSKNSNPIITTPVDCTVYDENGYNKYHIIEVHISDVTDLITFYSFKELIQNNNCHDNQILTIIDHMIEFTMASDIRLNFGINKISNISLVPKEISPFCPDVDILYIYFTPNSHLRISENYFYSYYNLYKCVNDSFIGDNGNITFLAQLETEKAILINFYRKLTVFPFSNNIKELKSINTNTLLNNFMYNYTTGEVNMSDHNLKIGDIIITDQFSDYSYNNELFVYEITKIINYDIFIVKKYKHGQKYKFIYDSIIINFNDITNKESIYWLDQVNADIEICPLDTNQNIFLNNTLSFISVVPKSDNKNIMKVYHPNHQLNEGDIIFISNSMSINQVPEKTINKKHIINKIIDDNYYRIILDKYIPIPLYDNFEITNIISIKYPSKFQLLFNFPDTLGNILNFKNVGHETSITEYKHIINNNDEYQNGIYKSLKKINMTGYNYFYLCCPELAHIKNTSPVKDVFSIMQWTENPGNIVFNSFVPTTKIFDIPISTLSILHFSIYHPDGKLVNFNGLDHSFTIEIIELYDQQD